MATFTPLSTFHSPICRISPCRISDSSHTRFGVAGNLHFQPKNSCCGSINHGFRTYKEKRNGFGMKVLRVVEEDTLVSEVQEGGVEQGENVSVPISPSDTLTMFLQADGLLSESAVPNVTKALEATEGISSLKVQVLEGIATVELTKQTTVQSTGVASSLVEIIQGAGFKLQTLNLSFEDEDDVLV